MPDAPDLTPELALVLLWHAKMEVVTEQPQWARAHPAWPWRWSGAKLGEAFARLRIAARPLIERLEREVRGG